MKEKVLNTEKEEVGEVELEDRVFDSGVNKALIYEVIKMQRACQREGTAATRNHALVSGTTAKMYRQKGTGRARHGDARTNIFVGGGKAFGPHPRDYSYRLPKKARKGAVRAVLSLKKKEGKFLVLNELKVPVPKTKEAVKILSKLDVKSALILGDGLDESVARSFRNISGVKLLPWQGINAYDLLKYEYAIVTVPTITKLQEMLMGTSNNRPSALLPANSQSSRTTQYAPVASLRDA